MDIEVNQHKLTLADTATLSDVLAAFGAKLPYAVAVNGDFVARGEYVRHVLQAGDRVDVVQPVAGG